MQRKKTWARELAVILIALATGMTAWMVYTQDAGASGIVSTYLVSTFGFLTAAFIKAGWENHKADELEAQLPPELEPDPVPPKGFGE
jgi:hypothetical protein